MTGTLNPEDFAPYSEDALTELASQLQGTPTPLRTGVLEADAMGAALVDATGDADAVIQTLLAIWGEEMALAA